MNVTEQELLELLAELEHQQWSAWIKHMLVKSWSDLDPLDGEPNGDITVPRKYAHRWTRQAYTNYKDLTEKEKESDREWARKVIEVMRKYWWEE